MNVLYRAVAMIPAGKVATYGQLAALVGDKNPRHIGSALHRNPDPTGIPCHRVVNAAGLTAQGFAFGGALAQRAKLEREHAEFIGSRVNLSLCRWQPAPLLRHFFRLLERFGEPGPWPWFNSGEPHTKDEIAIGAVLTQATSWRTVEYALANLRRVGAATLERIIEIGSANDKKLKELIRPAGFFNQKFDRLMSLAHFVQKKGGLKKAFRAFGRELRGELLALSGIGRETADTILLYCGDLPFFVIDAYTKRFCAAEKISSEDNYEKLRSFFENNLPRNTKLYQDFHALIVAWGKTATA